MKQPFYLRVLRPVLRPVLLAFCEAIVLEVKKKYPDTSNLGASFAIALIQAIKDDVINKFLKPDNER